MNTEKVLLIENDPKYLESIQQILEDAGYTVFTATQADVGFSIAKNVLPSIVLLNLATPGTNGLDICKDIHSTESLKDTPIVLLTLKDGNYDPLYESLYGIVGFIKKPVKPETLPAEVSKWIGISPAQPAAVAPAQANMFEEPAEDFMTEGAGKPAAQEATSESFRTEEDLFSPPEGDFTDSLRREGISEDDPPRSRAATPTWPRKKPMSVKKSMLVVSAGLAIVVVGLVTFFLLGGGGPQTPQEPSSGAAKSIFSDNKTVLPRTADVNGVIHPALTNTPSLALLQSPAANTPVALVNSPVANAPVSTAPMVNAASIKASATNKPLSAAPKPKPEPKPEPRSEPRKPAPQKLGPGHYVQFGVFGKKNNASWLVSELKAKGLNVEVKESTTHAGKSIYRVLMPESYATDGEAQDIAKQVKRSKGVETSTYSE